APRKHVRAQTFVERRDDVGEFQLLRFLGGGVEIRPEVAQQLFPRQLAGGDVVQLQFEIRGEVIFDIVLEEAGEERRDDAPLRLRNETAAFELHIEAIAQHRENTG